MTPRDPTKPEPYYAQAIQKRKDTIASLEENIGRQTQDNTPMLCTWLQGQYTELADLMYSRGEAISDIVPVFEKTLDVQALKMQHYRQQRRSPHDTKEETTTDFPEFKKALASLVEPYYHILLTLSKAVLLNIDTDRFKRYAWDATRPGVDHLFDRLIHYKLPDWPVSGKLHYAKKFNDLHLALEAASEAERAQHLASYVKNWMQKMKGNPLFGPHMLRDLNYSGYWCYAAPAIARITGTPDEGFRQLKYYPKEFRAEGVF